MFYQTHTLSNGLRIIHLPSSSQVSYCGFIINSGTRDELPGQSGIAHFTEHLIFKGTEKRRARHILNRMERVGGELNAFTTKEETTVYALFLEEHFERAFELLSDIIQHSCFPEAEIEKEIEVILDEINSYRDTPSELIYDEFENILFQGHAIGHNILGDPNELERFTSDMGRSFLKKNYTPDNMVFFSLGKTPFKKIVRLAEKYFHEINTHAERPERKTPDHYTPFERKTDLETYQTHTIIGNRTFNMFDERRAGLILLNNLIGGPGMNSLLNLSLREKHGYVYTIESSITSYTDTGIFAIYFGTDPQKTERCVNLTLKELKRMREKRLTELQLHAAKKQLIGQIGVGTDNHENTVLGMGKAFLHFGKYDSTEDVARRIDRVSSSELLEIANELLEEKSLSRLTFH